MSCYLLANNINDIVAARADYNGYVREGAIMRIAELCGISALEYLLRRVNDWGKSGTGGGLLCDSAVDAFAIPSGRA